MKVCAGEGTAGGVAIENLPGYLRLCLDLTDYPTYRQRDLAIGSEAVESAALQLVLQRAKSPVIRWTAAGLEAVLALWSISLNHDRDAFWETNSQRATA